MRRPELDGLRALCLFFVMLLHVCSSVWSEMALFTPQWYLATALRQTWAVPVLVMITGCLQLESSRPLSPALGRIARGFIGWSVVYQLYYLCRAWPDPDWKGLAAGLVTGAYHMWYLWMLAGLYLLTPLLRGCLRDRAACGYFLGLSFGIQALRSFGSQIPVLRAVCAPVAEMLNLDLGFLGYYVLGYYLHKWPVREGWLYPLGIICAGISAGGNLWLTWKTGANSEFFTGYLSPTMIFVSAAVFVFFTRRLPLGRTPAALGRLSLGMYLAHALVNEFVVALAGKQTLASEPLRMLPAAGLVFLGSFGAALGLEVCHGNRHRCGLGGRG